MYECMVKGGVWTNKVVTKRSLINNVTVNFTLRRDDLCHIDDLCHTDDLDLPNRAERFIICMI